MIEKKEQNLKKKINIDEQLAKKFPKDLKRHFMPIMTVGEGTYGTVAKALNIKTKEYVAIKSFKSVEPISLYGFSSTIIRQISTLRSLKHPNILSLIEIYAQSPAQVHLIFPYFPQNLYEFVQARFRIKQPLTPYEIKLIMFQVISAVQYMHTRRFVHRDLKPANILIDGEKLHVEVADFGLSRLVPEENRRITKDVATLWYRPPQVVLGEEKYSDSLDMWSIGCIFMQIILSTPIFHSSTETQLLVEIFKILGTPNEKHFPELFKRNEVIQKLPQFEAIGIEKMLPGFEKDGIDLIERLLCLDYVKRISSDDAKAHPYFNDLKDCELIYEP